MALFGIAIQYNRKDKTYYIDVDEIEDQSVTRMIDAFSIYHALQNGNKLSPSVFLEKKIIRNGTYSWNYSFHPKYLYFKIYT